MFITEAILLKKNSIRDTMSMIVLFTRDFGKLRVFVPHKKRSFVADTGSLLHCRLKVKGTITTLEEATVRKTPHRDELCYHEVYNLLSIIDAIEKIMPEGASNQRVYDDYKELIPFLESRSTNTLAKELFVLKMLKSMGYVSSEKITGHKDVPTIHANIERVRLRDWCIKHPIASSLLSEIRKLNLRAMDHAINHS
jgi:DNA repair protein RecO